MTIGHGSKVYENLHHLAGEAAASRHHKERADQLEQWLWALLDTHGPLIVTSKSLAHHGYKNRIIVTVNPDGIYTLEAA